MSKVSIQGDPSGSGTFTIASPNSNTDRTLTLPDSAGTIALQGGAGVGKVLQVVNGAMSSFVTTSSTSYVDVGGGASATITPSSTSSKILVLIDGQYATYGFTEQGRGNFRVLRDSTVLRENLTFGWYFAPDMTNDGNTYGSIAYNQLDAPNSTNALTYKVQFNRTGGESLSLNLVSVTLMEIAA